MKNKLPWDLIISKLRQELLAEDENTFIDWLNEDNNKILFQQLEIVWRNVQNKTADYAPDLEYYWKELSMRMDKVDSKTVVTVKKQQKAQRILFKPWYRKIAVAAILLLVSGVGLSLLFYNKTNSAIEQTYSSLAEKSKVLLPDGTVVWLNVNSVLTYNDSKKAKERSVTLEGEAFFDVKHDKDLPFVVKSGDVSITVHGTQFNVNSAKSLKNTVVSLFEGSVSMNIADVKFFLKPGEEARFDKETKVVSIEKGNIEYAKIWAQDKIRLENKNIREVCQYLSKWYGVEIVIDPSISNSQSYTFTLKDQTIEEIFQTMFSITPMDYTLTDNKVLITPSNSNK